MVYNISANESEPVQTNHINGTAEEKLARYYVTEL